MKCRILKKGISSMRSIMTASSFQEDIQGQHMSGAL